MGSGAPCRAGADVPWDPPVTSFVDVLGFRNACDFERPAQSVTRMHTYPGSQRLVQCLCQARDLLSAVVRNRLIRRAFFIYLFELLCVHIVSKRSRKSNCMDAIPTKWIRFQVADGFATPRFQVAPVQPGRV